MPFSLRKRQFIGFTTQVDVIYLSILKPYVKPIDPLPE